jgi:hypothetical protein
MRLILASSSLPLVLVATMVCGQQANPLSAPQTAQPTAVKNSGVQSTHAKAAHKSQVHQRAATHRKASSHKGAKRAAYRPEYTQNSVEVMNGASTQKVVFRNDDALRTSQKDKADPGYKVEIVNGTAQDTQYFNGDNPRTGSDEERPVVIGVQSSDTRVAGGNKHPVVTRITAVGRGDVKVTHADGQKVTTGISPKPKRPPYQPDEH